jgi:hypothetical protein
MEHCSTGVLEYCAKLELHPAGAGLEVLSSDLGDPVD